VALLLASREVGADPLRTAFFNPAFATALVALVILGASAWAAYDFAGRTLARRGDVVAGITLVLFNLVAVLSVEDEIGALWTRDNANLQRSLAISGFLMAYGAGLLAVGFWRRNAFVRWQALLLIIFTIAKVFLYDIGGLSQGYRVASFLGLGGLLMAVSFAYQKDWLGLRQAQTATSKDGGPA
jgi:uncharacterized membrane protein